MVAELLRTSISRGTPRQRRVREAPTTDATRWTRVAHREPHGLASTQVSWTIHPRQAAPMRLLRRVLVRLHAVEHPQHTLLAVAARVWRTEGGKAAGGTTACLPLSSSSPTWREGGLFHTAREAARIKKPQPGMVGVGTHTLPPLSLERTSQRYVGQVSWLAAFPYSLHLPKAKHLSGLCRFRSAYSCGAAMGLHHLPWSQAQTVTSPTSGIFDSMWELTVGPSGLSRTFLSEKKIYSHGCNPAIIAAGRGA